MNKFVTINFQYISNGKLTTYYEPCIAFSNIHTFFINIYKNKKRKEKKKKKFKLSLDSSKKVKVF